MQTNSFTKYCLFYGVRCNHTPGCQSLSHPNPELLLCALALYTVSYYLYYLEHSAWAP